MEYSGSEHQPQPAHSRLRPATPRTFVKLQNNLVGKPVALNQCAVGARQGEATLHLTDHSQTNTLVGTYQVVDPGLTVQVKVDTLDDYCARNAVEFDRLSEKSTSKGMKWK